MLEAKGVSLAYKDGSQYRKILEDVDLRLEVGGFTALLGPSGSGKSSLIYLLSLLREPTSGKIYLDGHEVTNRKDSYQIRYENFGFIFQQHFLISYLNVLENVCFASYDRKSVREDAVKILEELGLGDHMKKRPYQLSGGQRQRVSIARALVKKPRYIFADEPTASLDHETAVTVMDLLQEHCERSSVICATHDISVLPDACRKLYIGDGKIT